MLTRITEALGAVKDRALEASAKALINQKFADIGSVIELRIESKQKTMVAHLALNGETAPISISVGAYQVAQEDGVTCISFHGFSASREWIGVLLNKYLAGQKLPIPDALRMGL